MGKPEKNIEAWRQRVPVEVRKEQVLAVLQRWFPDQYEFKSGSHIVVTVEKFRGRPGYGPDGDFSIPVRNGQTVKGFYVKGLIQAIDTLREMESGNDVQKP